MNDDSLMYLAVLAYASPFAIAYLAHLKLKAHPDSTPWKIVFWLFFVLSVILFIPIAPGFFRYSRF